MPRTDWKRPDEFSAPQGRRRVALTVSYDGRPFCGWQSQEEGLSVQDLIKNAAEKLTGQNNITVCGSGRTDSKVHARGQVAHIEMDDCTIPAIAFNHGLNSFLPKEIRITEAWDCGPNFHARYSAMAREYRYFLTDKSTDMAFNQGLVTYYRRLPDIDLLNSYAKCLLGTHDFTTFTCARDICPSKVRDIYESYFFKTQDLYGNTVLCFKICGNAFLYHMIRSLVGSMVEFGNLGKTTLDFKNALDSKDRSLAGKTAPSDGLYLWRISYDKQEYAWFEEENGKSYT